MASNDIDPDREPRLSDPVVRSDEQSGMAMVGIVAAVAVALIAGLIYLNTGSETTTTSNTSPGVTTGSAPPPPSAPPGSGDKSAPASR
jgi:hypothetical protein